ncbi:helix-turn-helix transcriptional regulator [Mesorhizobium sp. B2-4-13]|uniref:helix-turn-helix transcriptional regulator n=1 Tax=Mesorhizobium sp. B2-4-13 TaxID=2589936 RepID=UPI0011528FBC|nr:helix-turn-helix transcriptional regulator [Mesorhizobium sp. B2-4-13]TPK85698.1 helix-turn-helix transcriptional regulator [Mesorhizobium sp. B2-4-13]
MVKPTARSFSRYSTHAAKLLGQSIRLARIERKLTIADLAERAGLSRGLVQRIERGDMGCAIGAVFEAAAIVGIRLFDAGEVTMTLRIMSNEQVLTLLPQSVRTPKKALKDDF